MNAISITFIEVSPFLRTLQAQALGVHYPAIEYRLREGGLKIPAEYECLIVLLTNPIPNQFSFFFIIFCFLSLILD